MGVNEAILLTVMITRSEEPTYILRWDEDLGVRRILFMCWMMRMGVEVTTMARVALNLT